MVCSSSHDIYIYILITLSSNQSVTTINIVGALLHIRLARYKKKANSEFDEKRISPREHEREREGEKDEQTNRSYTMNEQSSTSARTMSVKQKEMECACNYIQRKEFSTLAKGID